LIYIFSPLDSHLIDQKSREYATVTGLLGAPQNNDKDEVGQVVLVLGYTFDTLLFEMRIPQDKLNHICTLVAKTLSRRSITLYNVQALAGYLAYASAAIQLGWVFCKRI
jgi:hypothetical protein